tara:strand:+ start:4054 stop:4743 length:690 start_codon:yes stop_codon:yes gene_type:complete
MLGLMMEFIYYFMLFATGDYFFYFWTNVLYEKYNRINVSNKDTDSVPDFSDWVLGNGVSYVFLYLIYTKQIGHLYANVSDYSITYTLISPIAYFFIQDFMFYVLHRTAHIPFLYQRIHYVHHKHRKPTSWSVRISHWIDSNVENIAFTLPVVVMPIHEYMWMSCLMFTLLWGNFLHDSKKRIQLYLLNDNSDHCVHHYYGEKNCNYSYYFNHWDKIFGTYKKMKIRTNH